MLQGILEFGPVCFMKRQCKYDPSTRSKVHGFFVHDNACPYTANIVKQFLAKKKEDCKLNIHHFLAKSQFSRPLPIPTNETRFERKEICRYL
ncbi:hypothetical protein TNCV_3480611 [Trichonephila clavipes]|nr:hypothetical protein TNCV_3480611 [Trichonephila clavipes]